MLTLVVVPEFHAVLASQVLTHDQCGRCLPTPPLACATATVIGFRPASTALIDTNPRPAMWYLGAGLASRTRYSAFAQPMTKDYP